MHHVEYVEVRGDSLPESILSFAVWDLSNGFRFLGLVRNAFYPMSCFSGWLYTATKWTGVAASTGA